MRDVTGEAMGIGSIRESSRAWPRFLLEVLACQAGVDLTGALTAAVRNSIGGKMAFLDVAAERLAFFYMPLTDLMLSSIRDCRRNRRDVEALRESDTALDGREGSEKRDMRSWRKERPRDNGFFQRSVNYLPRLGA